MIFSQVYMSHYTLFPRISILIILPILHSSAFPCQSSQGFVVTYIYFNCPLFSNYLKIFFLFFIIPPLFLLYVQWCFACMYDYVRVSDSQGLDLQTVMTWYGVLGIEPESSGRAASANLWATSPAPHTIFSFLATCSFWPLNWSDTLKFTIVTIF